MPTMKIVAATKNRGKLKELAVALDGLNVEVVPLSDFGKLPDAVENGATFAENALKKASFYAKLLNLPCLADDSGLVVDALNGAPGVHSARYAALLKEGTESAKDSSDAENNARLVAELQRIGVEKSPAAYECVLAFYNPADDAAITADGCCSGVIKTAARGDGGFGYDPYFYFSDDKTMAELTVAEKDAISHRGAAIRALRPKLADYLRKR